MRAAGWGGAILCYLEHVDPFLTLGISLGLGLLIGLQRERTENRLGGIRTFPLISLFGTFCGWLAARHGGWIVGVGLASALGIMLVSRFQRSRGEEAEPGQTTEVAALLTFALGAYLPGGSPSVAAVAAGVLIVLLHLKEPMHYFVEKMGRRDMTGLVQFVVITLIIFPLLPDSEYGPFAVLNPSDIWRMVVLIVGISLAGYVLYKTIGERAGTFLGGVLGGIISSTAATVSFARRTKCAPESAPMAAIAIGLASAMAYVRVAVELGVIARSHFPQMILPFTAMAVWSFGLAGATFWLSRQAGEDLPAPTNPADLKSALAFGAIYAVVLVAVAGVKQQFGSAALYGVAVISGLPNMDAITLSISRLVEAQRLEAGEGWRLILVASLSNLVFKAVVAGALGGRRLAERVGLLLGLILAGGLAVLWMWPEHWVLPRLAPGEQQR